MATQVTLDTARLGGIATNAVIGAISVLIASIPWSVHAEECLVVYVCEPVATAAYLANREHLVATLFMKEQFANRSAVNRDSDLFKATLAAEFRVLESGFSSCNVVLFTNELALSGGANKLPKCRVRKRGETFWHDEDFSFESPAADSSRVAIESPLSASSTLVSALSTAFKFFPPAEHQYSLILKGHGDPGYVMRPLIAADTQGMSQWDLDGVLRPNYKGVFDEQRPVGIKKSALLNELTSLCRDNQFRFELIFVEACDADLDDELASALPGIVKENRYATLPYPKHSNLDYRAIDIKRSSQDLTTSDAIYGATLEVGGRQLREARDAVAPVFIAFVCIFTILAAGAAVLWLRFRGGRAKNVAGGPSASQ